MKEDKGRAVACLEPDVSSRRVYTYLTRGVGELDARHPICLRRMPHSLGEQARRLEGLTTQLDRAPLMSGCPNLTIAEAQEQHWIDWRYLHAAEKGRADRTGRMALVQRGRNTSVV